MDLAPFIFVQRSRFSLLPRRPQYLPYLFFIKRRTDDAK